MLIDELIPFHDHHIAFLNLIKSCGKKKNLAKLRKMHADNIVNRNLFSKDVYIATALITAYAKCGAIEEARAVFEKLPVHDVVSWSALIGGYAQNKLAHKALECFKQMQDEGVSPNMVTYICVLKSCGISRSLEIGEEIACKIQEQGLFVKDIMIGNALVDMYTKCGALKKAQEVFDQLPMGNVVSWSTLIGGYTQNGLGHEALKYFRKMKAAGVSPNSVTYIFALKACGIVQSLDIGEDIDIEVRKQGFLQKDAMLGTALVDMYCKCGAFDKALKVFEQLPVRDVVSWNALISGYSQQGHGNEVLKWFEQMKCAGMCPDAVTYVCILKACSILGALDIGEDIDAEVRKKGLLHEHLELGNALVNMYSKCGALKRAREVFEQLPTLDVVSWNTLITGYAQNGHGDEVLRCFRQMQNAGTCPAAITYVCILKACSILGSLDIGEDIYADIRKQGVLEKEVIVGTALVDMYAKCGALSKAREVFEQIPERNVVAWSAMIAGYGHLGQANVIFGLYSRMRAEDVMPNLVTFTILLSACSHAGLIKEGEKLFDEMFADNVTPTVEHYTCMIDLFGRAGHFDKVKACLDKVPNSSQLLLFRCVLGSCREWKNLKLGRWAFEQSLQLDENCAAAYVCMGNIYASAEMQTRWR